MAGRVLVDSGPLVALLNRRDIHHAWAQRELANLHEPLLTCEAVLSEVFCLLSRIRNGTSLLVALLRDGLVFLITPSRLKFCATWNAIRVCRCRLPTPALSECVKLSEISSSLQPIATS